VCAANVEQFFCLIYVIGIGHPINALFLSNDSKNFFFYSCDISFLFQGYPTIGTISTHSLNSENTNLSSMRPLQMSNVNVTNFSNQNPSSPKNQNPLYGTNSSYPISPTNVSNFVDSPSTNRQTPEGKDNDDVMNEIKLQSDPNSIHGLQKNKNVDLPEVYSTTNSENGKINVQVTVLFGKFYYYKYKLILRSKLNSQSNSQTNELLYLLLTNQEFESKRLFNFLSHSIIIKMAIFDRMS
jgi:hypothetical protein